MVICVNCELFQCNLRLLIIYHPQFVKMVWTNFKCIIPYINILWADFIDVNQLTIKNAQWKYSTTINFLLTKSITFHYSTESWIEITLAPQRWWPRFIICSLDKTGGQFPYQFQLRRGFITVNFVIFQNAPNLDMLTNTVILRFSFNYVEMAILYFICDIIISNFII